jgi:transposase
MIEWNDKESNYRAKIILLRDNGYTVPEIRMATNHHDINIRKWIHRFNEKGIEGIISKIHAHKSIRMGTEMEKKIVEIATKIQGKTMDYLFQHGRYEFLQDMYPRS